MAANLADLNKMLDPIRTGDRMPSPTGCKPFFPALAS
jgi:hypothetical protein